MKIKHKKMINWKAVYIVFVIFVFYFNETVEAKSIKKSAASSMTASKVRSPVIFVPGNGGSQINAKLNKPSVVHYICTKHTDDWFNIWLNEELLVPLVIDCFIDNVKLNYDNATRRTTNAPGVETIIPGWGSPEVVEWIDPSQAAAGAYFKEIGNALNATGYQRNISIRGSPYDFRKAPNENKQWFLNMKDLVEETYQINNNTPVTFITHSMGSPMTLLFLQQLTTQWKEKHVARIISLAGAWAGSVKAVKVFAMGDDLGAFALSGKVMRAEQITMPSLSWLLPSPLFWKSNEVLVETPSHNYTFAQLEQYFNDIDYRTGWEMRLDNLQYSIDFSPPGVELHCIYGTQVPTVERLRYKKDAIAGEKPDLVYGDGDGTVNLRSLKACVHWRQWQTPSISTLEVPKVDHMNILNDKHVIQYILDVLT